MNSIQISTFTYTTFRAKRASKVEWIFHRWIWFVTLLLNSLSKNDHFHSEKIPFQQHFLNDFMFQISQSASMQVTCNRKENLFLLVITILLKLCVWALDWRAFMFWKKVCLVKEKFLLAYRTHTHTRTIFTCFVLTAVERRSFHRNIASLENCDCFHHKRTHIRWHTSFLPISTVDDAIQNTEKSKK